LVHNTTDWSLVIRPHVQDYITNLYSIGYNSSQPDCLYLGAIIIVHVVSLFAADKSLMPTLASHVLIVLLNNVELRLFC